MGNRKSEKKVVKLKNICARYASQFKDVEDLLSKMSDLHDGHIFKDSKYKWDSLLSNIKEEGLKNPIQCDMNYDHEYPVYNIFNGEHRYLVLKSLYDEDHEIEIIVVTTPSQYIKEDLK